MRGKAIYCLIIILIIFTLSACGSNYNKFESEFMDEYYKVIEDIESKEVKDILVKLQSEENAAILNNMKKLLEDNEDISKGNKKITIS
jgi:hypothetical protein